MWTTEVKVIREHKANGTCLDLETRDITGLAVLGLRPARISTLVLISPFYHSKTKKINK